MNIQEWCSLCDRTAVIESIEIIADKHYCNLMEHALIHPTWNPFVVEGRMDIKQPSSQAVMEKTDEGTGHAENVFHRGLLGF